MSRSVILILLFLNSFISSAQNNCLIGWPSEPVVTGNNATYLIYNVTFDDEEFFYGKLGAFFTNDQGALQCGGWVNWVNNTVNSIAVWGDDTTTPEKDGFAEGEEIIWLAESGPGQTAYQATLTYTEGAGGIGSSIFTSNSINVTSEFAIISSVLNYCNSYILGCIDSDYLEYNPTANYDNGSCNELKISGCMDPLFIQYNPLANSDNGSCEVLIRDALSELISLYNSSDSIISELELNTESWNNSITLQEGWNMFGYGCPIQIDLVQGLSNHTDLINIVKENNGAVYMPEYNFNSIGNLIPGFGYQINVVETIEDFRLCDWYIDNMYDYDINNTDLDLSSIQSDLDCYENPENCSNELGVLGCMNEFALNYNSLATVDDGSCILIGCSDPTYLEYYTQGFIPSSNDQAYNDLFCFDIAVLGCTDSLYFEYNSEANVNDGSCVLAAEYGCMDQEALNFNSSANMDNGSCEYLGCTDDLYLEFDSSATNDDGSCLTISIPGCIDSSACNFNPESNMSDGSCEYAEEGFECFQITQGNIHQRVANWISNPDSIESIYGHISDWDVSNVTDMSSLFENYLYFNDDLSSWDVSSVTDMSYMFSSASNFTGDISSWDVSNVTDMSNMFSAASNFTGDISSWDVSSVTDMGWMFQAAYDFTGDLSSWDVSNVTGMEWMFWNADDFTSDLSSWDVSNVTDMSYMFSSATNFTSDLSSWDVSNVTDMSNLFQNCLYFTGDLSSWDVSNVTDMSSMFYGATSFTSDLSSWDVSNIANMTDMFFNSGMTPEDLCSTQETFSMSLYWPYDWECSVEVGDYAHGGIVFYVDSTGQHGLVAALEDLTEDATIDSEGNPGYQWGCFATWLSGADGQAIGTGYQNTLDIVAGCSETPIAASEALAYESEDYSDWYLPSLDELNEMYNTIGYGGSEGNIGSFSSNWYWSSSESNNYGAYDVNFGDGSTGSFSSKTKIVRVRVIRSF